MVHDPISVLDALMIALSGIVIVFLMLALLWGVIAVISRVMGVLEKHTAHPASVSAAAPAAAPGVRQNLDFASPHSVGI